MFDSRPHTFPRVVVEASKTMDSIRDVRARGDRKIVECSNCSLIGNVLHLSAFFISLGRIVLGEVEARVHGCEDRCTSRHAESVEEVDDILTLTEPHGPVLPITSDGNAEEEVDGAEVTNLEVLVEEGLDVVGELGGLGHDGDVVDKDRDDDLDALAFSDVNGRV